MGFWTPRHPAIQTTGLLTLALAGLSPAEHTSLYWSQHPAVTLPPVPLLSIAADLDVYDKDTIGFALATLLRGRNAALDAIDRADAAVTRAMAN